MATAGLSSPIVSSAELEEGSSTPRASKPGSASSEGAHLTVRKQPPTYIFPDEVFEVEVGLEVGRGGLVNSPSGGIGLSLTLSGPDDPTSSSRQHSSSQVELIVLDEARISLTRKNAVIRCQLRCRHLSHSHGAASGITISTIEEFGIAPCTSHAIHLVNSKISVAPMGDWSSIWYKDEGGRDKCMEVMVKAYDRYNQLVYEHIPLSITLFYAAPNMPAVTNQELLRLLGSESKLGIDKSTAQGIVRYRIEDVSKNHQGQDFIVEITPDRKAFQDVAPGLTPPVSIRSKRNKRPRQSSSASTAAGAAVRGSLSSTSERASPSAAGGYDAPVLEGGDPLQLQEAIEGVIQWADEVVNGLYPLQWQVLGYAQNPDGTTDYSRPYHNMPNPNPVIHRALSVYNDSTRGHLKMLRRAVEKTVASQEQHPMHQHHEPFPLRQVPEALRPGLQRDDYAGMIMPPAMHRDPYARPMSATAPSPRPDTTYHGFPVQHSSYYPREGHSVGRSFEPPLPMAPSQGMPSITHASLPPSAHHRVMHEADDATKMPAAPSAAASLESREPDVEYLLAKQYKSIRTGERLGFPAYSDSRELIGFYREAPSGMGATFVPIERHTDEFGPLEFVQARQILEDTLANKSEAVQMVKDWGSISGLIDHCMVYDFSTKSVGDAPRERDSVA